MPQEEKRPLPPRSGAKPPPVPSDPVYCSAKKYVFSLHKKDWVELNTMLLVPNPAKGFEQGGMRVCFDVDEIDEGGGRTHSVAKFFRRTISDVVEKDYFSEGEAQCMCEEFATNFNKVKVPNFNKPNISFLQCQVIRIEKRDIPKAHQGARTGFFSYRTQNTHECMFVMEPKLNGHFTKYNNNFGETYAEESKKYKLTPEQKQARDRVFTAAEAFSHFTLHDSGGSMLLCDLQGVNDLLTDPQIHTEDGKGLGMGNMGQEGIDKWAEKHNCNDICRALHLTPIGRNVVPDRETIRNNHYVNLREQMQNKAPVQAKSSAPQPPKPVAEMSEDERIEWAIKLSSSS